MNVAIQLTQKQYLIAYAIIIIPNYALFIKTNMKEALKNTEIIDARGKNDGSKDDKLIFKGALQRASTGER